MPTISAIQSVFNKGELTPKLHARIDSPYYRQGLSACENFHVLVQGGITKRPGTQFCGTSLRDRIDVDPNHSRLIPFIFSETQAYALEFGDYQMGLFINGSPVTTAPGSGVRYTVPTIYPVGALKDLGFVQTADVVYLTHPDYPVMKLLRYGETDWRFEVANFVNGPFLDLNVKANVAAASGTTIPTITVTASDEGSTAIATNALLENPAKFWGASLDTPWLQYDFGTTPQVCSGYVIIAARRQGGDAEAEQRMPYQAPRKWKLLGSNNQSDWVLLDQRRGEANWLPSETRAYYFTNTRTFRYYRIQIEANNGDRNFTAIGCWQLYLKNRPGTLTFENTINVNNGTGLSSKDIGRLVKWQGEDGFWRYFRITGIQSATAATGMWTGFWTFSQDRTQNWAMGAFSQASGYPRTATIFQERLCLAGTYAQPRTVHMSASADYEDFEVPDQIKDDTPLSITMAGARRDRIEWIREIESLLMVATTDNIASLGGTENNVISPTNVQQRRHAGFGAAVSLQPIRVGSVMLFVGNHANTLHELVYSAQSDGYEAPAISVLADHMYAGGIVDTDFAQTPHDLVYLPCSNGTMIALAYERQQQVVGHAKFTFPNGEVRSICVIPESNRDVLYMVVRRVIDGEVRHYVERMQAAYEFDTSVPFWYLDSALRYYGAPTSTLSGLGHLEGQEVKVYGFDATDTPGGTFSPAILRSTFRVVNGTINLPIPVTDALVGLAYTAKAQLLPHAVEERDGSSIGRSQRVERLLMNLLNTHSLTVQSNERLLPTDEILLRAGEQEMDAWTPLFTGSIEIPVEDTWEGEGKLILTSSEPLPCTILAATLMIDREPGLPARMGG